MSIDKNTSQINSTLVSLIALRNDLSEKEYYKCVCACNLETDTAQYP